MAFEGLGKLLIYIGIIVVLLGGLFLLAGKVSWLGRLPGDLLIRRSNFTIYIPITTMLLVSLLLTLLLNVFFRR
ncbi:hypothetical protein A2276_01090 [candidate division WOR-1 bacterium RIFOXYA12_FULL_43_27]|uniref:DUF2905 domain-containing protein n=1 Tax=candidate division WOR-1 bacterium RIFOXYC2_FULL_46_14 TaxID=1802587 RepID=A0A1F4U4W9_UNCSA|nr:MAG: hypothetical protein A2276_01090 [candidate division WOR-1 bacterium RIFOXYA12_FULL_43_27]OGC20719.1 MAG: hypothetical protein A2292_06785 [candidate division WOR-1 bacterium RIFOXYB2_FULL_46_45]OGC31544.1 MAG: hypothetical protein A2232_04665 [candidate division WOR-1 bacterium RIFOXYA2_FULL_46_56]OGC39951.1 MAG: hypothetical protein A2438_05505 [candidate division WOR-1 bacterium RIFOXYC2_FULL_46_14]